MAASYLSGHKIKGSHKWAVLIAWGSAGHSVSWQVGNRKYKHTLKAADVVYIHLSICT